MYLPRKIKILLKNYLFTGFYRYFDIHPIGDSRSAFNFQRYLSSIIRDQAETLPRYSTNVASDVLATQN